MIAEKFRFYGLGLLSGVILLRWKPIISPKLRFKTGNAVQKSKLVFMKLKLEKLWTESVLIKARAVEAEVLFQVIFNSL